MLICTNYVNFGKCQHRFDLNSWSNTGSNYMDVNLKLFKKDDNKHFHWVQNLTIREAVFIQFMRLRNHLVIAAENFAREETLSPVLIPTMSKDLDERLKQAPKVVDVVDRPYRRICVILLRYKMDKPGSSYAPVVFFVRKMEGEKFQQVAYLN